MTYATPTEQARPGNQKSDRAGERAGQGLPGPGSQGPLGPFDCRAPQHHGQKQAAQASRPGTQRRRIQGAGGHGLLSAPGRGMVLDLFEHASIPMLSADLRFPGLEDARSVLLLLTIGLHG